MKSAQGYLRLQYVRAHPSFHVLLIKRVSHLETREATFAPARELPGLRANEACKYDMVTKPIPPHPHPPRKSRAGNTNVLLDWVSFNSLNR